MDTTNNQTFDRSIDDRDTREALPINEYFRRMIEEVNSPLNYKGTDDNYHVSGWLQTETVRFFNYIAQDGLKRFKERFRIQF
jgi:hypothetical protein